MKRVKSKRTPKGGRLLDSHRPCVLSAICGCHQQALKVKVNKPLGKTIPRLQIVRFKTRKLFSGRSDGRVMGGCVGGPYDSFKLALMVSMAPRP